MLTYDLIQEYLLITEARSCYPASFGMESILRIEECSQLLADCPVVDED